MRCRSWIVAHGVAIALFFVPAWSVVSAQSDQHGGVIASGQVTNVVCTTDPRQTYALYLPSGYAPSKSWPIIYFFDPGGRGSRPIELYKDIAEKYGFIFAGSNNSRNFSGEEAASVNAIWQDTHGRFAIDAKRTYASGFSGGARVAGAMALSCVQCQIAGVVAHGAGYPSGKARTKDRLLYYFAVGDRDFNWPEVVTLRREREEQGLPYRVRVYSGTHQWAPLEVMEDAIQWFVLLAMQSGDAPRDEKFINRQFEQLKKQAAEAEKASDAITRLAAYRSLVSDFSGLKDAKEFEVKLSALKQSEALKRSLKQERDLIELQFALEREISPKLTKYMEGAALDLSALRQEIVQAMGGLKDQAVHAKNESKRLVYRRAFDDMSVEEIENGQQELQFRHFEKAEQCFQLMTEVSDGPWPWLLLADTHAEGGSRKQALGDLHKAVSHGLKDADAVESDPHLSSLKDDPDFRKVVADLRKN